MRRFWLVLLVLVCLIPGSQPERPAPALGPLRDDWSDDGSPLPTQEQFAELARTNPVAMLDVVLRRGTRELAGYRATLVKRETINGVTHPEEEIAVSLQFHPYSVRFDWRRGEREADRCLYVSGQNDGQILVRPIGRLAETVSRLRRDNIFERPLSAPLVRAASRYSILDSHMLAATERSWRAWSRAQRLGRLHVEYQGERTVPEAGGRRCHVLVRTCDPPEEEGLTTLWAVFDAETWLQVGTRLTAGDRLIGYYYFRDVELNPSFPPETFTRSALAR